MRSVQTILCALFLLFIAGTTPGAQDGRIEKSFAGVREIDISTTSGDCIVQKGGANEVTVTVKYTYDDEEYDAEMEQRGSKLVLKEKFHGWNRSHRGESVWTLTVPDDLTIDFSTASGDLEIRELKCSLAAKTASGDITLRKVAGDFEMHTASGDADITRMNGSLKLSTASGDVTLNSFDGKLKISTASGNIEAADAKGLFKLSTASGEVDLRRAGGEFQISTASGDIEAEEIDIQGRGKFTAASGDVDVSLAKKPAADVKLSAASGDVVLDFNDHPIVGYIEMTAKEGRGRIRAPFEFDQEETYQKWGDEYVTRRATRGSKSPAIILKTSTGNAVIKK